MKIKHKQYVLNEPLFPLTIGWEGPCDWSPKSLLRRNTWKVVTTYEQLYTIKKEIEDLDDFFGWLTDWDKVDELIKNGCHVKFDMANPDIPDWMKSQIAEGKK